MACFLIPAAEAVITTAITKITESKEKKAEKGEPSVSAADISPSLWKSFLCFAVMPIKILRFLPRSSPAKRQAVA